MKGLQIKKAFTLIEIMVWIIIVSLVIIWWFQALSSVTIWKARIIQQTDIQKESFYFTEKLFEMIKKWWTIDYEEYFNRKVIWNTTYSSWHFDEVSWFGNFWNAWTVVDDVTAFSSYGDLFYKCTSLDSDPMTWTGCVSKFNLWSVDYDWEDQRYGEYSFQFIDYNSNYDNDLWDEDGDSDPIWDDDDEYIWEWPEVFSNWVDLKELYLISGDKLTRTIFRWYVDQDPDATSSCTIDNTNTITWTGCIGTIQYLKLDWVDFWMWDHVIGWAADNTENDWIIDTWLINPEFTWWTSVIAWNVANDYWQPLFPDTVNVTKFEVFAYPNKDINYAWKNYDPAISISPYVILKLSIKPSWKTRKMIKWEWKEMDFSMTINLSDIYSK